MMENLRALAAAAQERHPITRLRLLGDVRAYVRLNFLVAAKQAGLLDALAVRPASAADLAQRLEIQQDELLAALLELGVAVRELGRASERYRLRGRRAAALTGPDGEVPTALAEELAGYHGAVYRDLPALLRGNPAPDYLATAAPVVATSSRVAEPFALAPVKQAADRFVAPAVLDVGCGSGVYLRAVASANPAASGVGLELVPEVAAQAEENLRRWHLADRFSIRQGDIRSPAAGVGGPFDLILLMNNVYYFSTAERAELFSRLRGLLTSHGILLLVSLLRGNGLITRNLDLVLSATPGCHRLPSAAEVTAELSACRLVVTRTRRLIPGLSCFAVWAEAASSPPGCESGINSEAAPGTSRAPA